MSKKTKQPAKPERIPTRKLEKGENYLELIPVKNPSLHYTVDDNGRVTLTVPNIGFFNKIAQVCFQRPEESKILFDPYSSYIWLGIDGKRNVEELGVYMKARYGEKAEPLYPRLVKFINILKDNRYAGLVDKYGTRIR